MRPLTLLVAALLGACDDACEVEQPLDYRDAAHWLCRPDQPGACADTIRVVDVAPDGALTEATIAREPAPTLACFAVYPTLDLRLRATLHTDLAESSAPEGWAASQAGPLHAACALWIPIYRQATIGTFIGPQNARKARCLDSAYADVLAAFEAFLDAEPERGIVLFGHSQGGMHLSRLIRERIESDPEVLDRLVAAYPIGWALGTARGEPTGGSFQSVPVCAVPDETGCVVGFRSYLQGNDPPTIGTFQEGAEAVCVHPAMPEDMREFSPLRALVATTSHPTITAPEGVDGDAHTLVRWPDAFEGRCVADADGFESLQVRWVRPDPPPYSARAWLLAGHNGTHILDVNLGQADLVEDMATRGRAWHAARP